MCVTSTFLSSPACTHVTHATVSSDLRNSSSASIYSPEMDPDCQVCDERRARGLRTSEMCEQSSSSIHSCPLSSILFERINEHFLNSSTKRSLRAGPLEHAVAITRLTRQHSQVAVRDHKNARLHRRGMRTRELTAALRTPTTKAFSWMQEFAPSADPKSATLMQVEGTAESSCPAANNSPIPTYEEASGVSSHRLSCPGSRACASKNPISMTQNM